MDAVIDAVISHLHYTGLFILLLLGGVGLPLPEDIILLTCGGLISAGALDPLPAVLAVYSGMLVSDFVLYSVGKKYGRRILERERFRRFISRDRLKVLEERFNGKGTLVILFGRHLAGLRAQIFLAAGIMGMPPARFVAADAVSALITIAIMVGLGYKGTQGAQALLEGTARFRHAALAVLALLLASYAAYSYFRGRRAGKAL